MTLNANKHAPQVRQKALKEAIFPSKQPTVTLIAVTRFQLATHFLRNQHADHVRQPLRQQLDLPCVEDGEDINLRPCTPPRQLFRNPSNAFAVASPGTQSEALKLAEAQLKVTAEHL